MLDIRNGFDHAWTTSGRRELSPETSAIYRDRLSEVLDLLIETGVIPTRSPTEFDSDRVDR